MNNLVRDIEMHLRNPDKRYRTTESKQYTAPRRQWDLAEVILWAFSPNDNHKCREWVLQSILDAPEAFNRNPIEFILDATELHQDAIASSNGY